MQNAEEKTLLEAVWCIAANIVHERKYGPGGEETRRGTKQFAPGAKVYVVCFRWDNVEVVGRHRKSHRFINLYTRGEWLVNWRAELVYSPYVIQKIVECALYKPKETNSYGRATIAPPGWHSSPEAKNEAERYLELVKKNFPHGNNTQPPTVRVKNDSHS